MEKTAFIDETRRCMKCGFCMSLCPVYDVEHIESHVARGRNMLVHWASNNEMPADKSYRESLKHCLLCGRCESVCPANVPSTSITLQARSEVAGRGGINWRQRWVHGKMIRQRALFARLLKLMSKIPGFSSSKGGPLRHLADFVSVFSGRKAIPRMSPAFLSECLPAQSHPPADVPVRGEVAIFPGCAFEFFFSHIGQSVVSVLTGAGYIVAYPQDLTCCGIAVYNTGDFKTARQMAVANLEALAGFERVITGCATCSSALKHYADWFSEGDPLKEKARNLAGRVEDLTKFLVQNNFRPQNSEGERLSVTYHDPCHLRWYQGISAEPRELLRSLEGITYIEMPDADQCCGMGGSFGINCRETSQAIVEKKIASVRKTGADVLVTACPGCIIQLADACRKKGLAIKVMHISELLQGQKGPLRKPR